MSISMSIIISDEQLELIGKINSDLKIGDMSEVVRKSILLLGFAVMEELKGKKLGFYNDGKFEPFNLN